MTNKIQEAIKVITDAMREDKSEGSYYYSWQANIAMAFKDEWQKWVEEKVGRSGAYDLRHTIANNAAKNFLDLLISTPQMSEVTNQ